MAALDLEKSHSEILAGILEDQYSRYPVYRGDIDDIAGFIHAKDFLGRMVSDPGFDLAGIIRPPFFVPEGKKVNDLLKEMQRQRVHLAIVVDEYGGVSGMVTTEDLLEELVGEIEDEHDEAEPLKVQTLSDGSLLVDALLPVSELEEVLGITFEEDLPFDTLAGLVLHRLGRFPERGESLLWGTYRLTCAEVARNSVLRVRIESVD
jgi:putative hemolysin